MNSTESKMTWPEAFHSVMMRIIDSCYFGRFGSIYYSFLSNFWYYTITLIKVSPKIQAK